LRGLFSRSLCFYCSPAHIIATGGDFEVDPAVEAPSARKEADHPQPITGNKFFDGTPPVSQCQTSHFSFCRPSILLFMTNDSPGTVLTDVNLSIVVSRIHMLPA
jgi:hypothetical protein